MVVYLSFDFTCTGGESGAFYRDYFVVYYSTAAAGPYTALTNAINLTAGVQSVTLPLPVALNNQATVFIGFRWINDNSAGIDAPVVIDNIIVKGSNAAAPANNPCASASAMTFTGTTAIIVGNNACATADIINPSCYNTYRNVWHTFVCPTSGNYYASISAGTMTYPTFSILSFGTSCVAGTATQVGCGVYNGTSYASLSACSLVAGQTYYVMVDNYGDVGTYTLNIQQAISNDLVTTPAVVNSCGTTFTSSTIGATNCGDGSGSTLGNNLDNNAGTGGFGSGGDVGFSVENSSWYVFCNGSGAVATYTVTMTNLGGCTGPNGIQFAAFTGTTTSLSLQSGGTTGMNILSGNSFTSSVISLANNACAYIVVDGFAGTNCNYGLSVAAAPVCQLLKVDIFSFSALQKDDIIELTWATASEMNNDFYTIERSEDGINFKEIEKVKGAGISSNVLFYSSKDSNPLNGISYYRLKQTDFNGKHTYSKISSVEFENTKNLKFEIVPNPNMDNVISNIVLSAIPNNAVSIEITDAQGVVLYEVSKKTESNKIEIPNSFSKGIYFVKVICNDFVQTKRMMIK